MTIHYLHQMAAHPKLRRWTNEGLTLPAIEALEVEYNQGRPFPQAYCEFLYLGGGHCNLEDLDIGLGYAWLQTRARARLREYGQQIERPFWVTDQLDGCEQFGFIYLDEDQPDPTPYYCMPAYVAEGEPLIQPLPQQPFSRFIDECVARSVITDEHLRR
ncbi:hypothetical protein [Hymenobacter jeollabukensis]|uniref:SMI1/KNR4 family protein n=1 Tax=Hymenobacter jeollabukensis TaxID=2025313 RepID=A0A5R8WPK9_9BACT|nr:hypothetical protein [Hymenobacter jeollabukensis]TLM92243.1 hypothetical protein FDY95_12445 [Hymenobacter jeollabukensis]